MGCDFSLTANAETGQIESLSIPQKEFYSAVPLRPASRTDVACKMNIETYDPLFGEIRAAVFAFGRQLFSA